MSSLTKEPHERSAVLQTRHDICACVPRPVLSTGLGALDRVPENVGLSYYSRKYICIYIHLCICVYMHIYV